MARHKEFEPDAVLIEAMNLFWEQGYDRTSMDQLVARMGIHKRSMYDTFGDKRSLYLKAVSRYVDQAEASVRDLVENAASVREALRALFEWSLTSGSIQSRGCLLVNCATEVAPWDKEAATRVRRSFEVSQQLFHTLVDQGQRSGEVASRHDTATLATQLSNAWLCLRVQVRAGVDQDQLRRTVDATLAMLD